MKGRMRLDSFIFDCMIFSTCAVMVGCVMSKASLRPCVLDDIIMHVVVKGGVLDFIGLGGTYKCVVFC